MGKKDLKDLRIYCEQGGGGRTRVSEEYKYRGTPSCRQPRRTREKSEEVNKKLKDGGGVMVSGK